jgi:hypothetical protein
MYLDTVTENVIMQPGTWSWPATTVPRMGYRSRADDCRNHSRMGDWAQGQHVVLDEAHQLLCRTLYIVTVPCETTASRLAPRIFPNNPGLQFPRTKFQDCVMVSQSWIPNILTRWQVPQKTGGHERELEGRQRDTTKNRR